MSVCVCGGGWTVDCVKPMNKSVVSNSIWITAGGGGGGCNERGAGALQLHYLTDNSPSTDGRVWLKKVSALVKKTPPTGPDRPLWQVVWSLTDTALRLVPFFHKVLHFVCRFHRGVTEPHRRPTSTPWCPPSPRNPAELWGKSHICCFMKYSFRSGEALMMSVYCVPLLKWETHV